LDESPEAGHLLVLFDYYSEVRNRDSDLYARVWLRDGQRLKIIQQMRFNAHLIGMEQSFSFDAARKILTTRATHYRSEDAHCCLSAYDQLTFEWTGSEFQLKKKTTHRTE
jgi:hypothetical protein